MRVPDPDLADLDRWLRREGYAESTRRSTLAHAARVLRLPVAELRADGPTIATLQRLRRWSVASERRWGEASETCDLRSKCDLRAEIAERFLAVEAQYKEAKAQKRTTPRARRKQRERREPIDDHSWRQLCEALERDQTPAALVLRAMTESGQRVGDVLRVTREQLLGAGETITLRVKGDKPHVLPRTPAWNEIATQIRATKHTSIASWVSPRGKIAPGLAGYGAYQAVARKLRELGTALDVKDLRLWYSHRLRRTAADHVYRTTKDVRVVQELLGHENLQYTQRYLASSHPELVRDALEKAAKAFNK